MEWLVLGIVLLFGFYENQQSSIAPNEAYFYGFTGIPEICDDLSPLELIEAGIVKKGKKASYSNLGKSVCYRNIFEAGDRDPKVNLVAKAVKSQIHRITEKVTRINQEDSQIPTHVYIDTSAINEYELSRYLYHSTVTSLSNESKQTIFIKKIPSTFSYRVLKLSLAPTSLENDVIEAKYSANIDPGESIDSWMVL